ncbi:methyltransferase [Sphingomonas metalli]|uniref:Methyltransferase n=1 Tax=Sphingomonas metalli TaxID=1779358 RepID=A0A916SYQ0_9SPHN|nr:class I SAM-dependent methyltransferase [Sphingomonas metalli]GGB20532.1 methyltransferase [Sphingomonas metalli]
MKPIWTLTLMLAAAPVAAQQAPAPARPAATPVPATIAKALADPARADQQGDDERRQAAAVIAFSGVKPGDTVIDYLPGSGYWSRIFSGVVGPKGKVIAAWPARAGTSDRGKAGVQALADRKLPNVTAQIQPGDLPSSPVPADLFWTVQNYHDIPNRGAGEPALRAFDAAVFNLLKKGGTYVVIDHADAAGKGMANTETTHRIDPAAVRRQVEAAGFRFVGESRVLHNPEDDHSKNVFDPAIRGRTDQFVYKFRKP